MKIEIPDWATFRYTHPGAEPVLLPGESAYDVLQVVGMDVLQSDEIARLRYLERRDGKRWVPATHPEKLFHLYILRSNGTRIYLTSYPEPAHKAAILRDKCSRPHLVSEELDKSAGEVTP
mgnify:FL=1